MRCFAEAHRFRATFLVAKTNGDCLVCRNEEYKCSDCLTYGRDLRKRFFKTLLLRTRAESNVQPYDVFMSASTNRTALELADLAGTIAPYKSPLFDDVTGLNHVILELLLPNGTVAVKLKFAFTGNSLKNGANWFRPHNLMSAFPWDVEQMKNETYEFFNITGRHGSLRFYITTFIYNCQVARGYLMISNKKACSWEISSPYSTAYVWTRVSAAQRWYTGATEAIEFRISGEYLLDAGDRAYSVQC